MEEKNNKKTNFNTEFVGRKYKHYRTPRREEVEGRFEYYKNGRIKAESYYGNDVHKEYAGEVIKVMTEYERISIFEYAFMNFLKNNPDYINTERGVLHEKDLYNTVKEFYKSHPELVGQSVYLDYRASPKFPQHCQTA